MPDLGRSIQIGKLGYLNASRTPRQSVFLQTYEKIAVRHLQQMLRNLRLRTILPAVFLSYQPNMGWRSLLRRRHV